MVFFKPSFCSIVSEALKFKISTDFYVSYYHFLFRPLVFILILPHVLFAQVRFSPDVYYKQNMGEGVLFSYVFYTGFIVFGATGVRGNASYAPRVQ